MDAIREEIVKVLGTLLENVGNVSEEQWEDFGYILEAYREGRWESAGLVLRNFRD